MIARTRKLFATTFALPLALAALQPVQTAFAVDEELTEIIVTGSNIASAGVRDVPVVVLGKQQLEESGVTTNVLEALRKSIPAFAGRSNAGTSNGSNTNQATGGGSQISLRNLPTLVLVNGRRVTYSSINGSGGKNFVDVNMIPIAAIERVEVLTDGASAIYGSDAVGGVVNIILKSDFEGFEVDGRYAGTDNTGHYSERTGSAVYGVKTESNNLTLSLNWSKSDPLFQSQRAFIASDPRPAKTYPGIVNGNYLNSSLNSPSQTNPVGANAASNNFSTLIGNGTYLAAGNPSIPQFDIAPYTSLLLQQETKSATADFASHLIGDRLVAFGNAVFSNTQSSNNTANSLTNAEQLGVTVPAGAPYNPLTVAVPGTLVGTVGTPQQTRNDSNAFILTFGLRGDITDHWNWEAGYTYSKSRLDQQYTNTVFRPNLIPAIAGGYDASGNPVAGGTYSKVIGGFNINGPTVLQPALDPFARGGLNRASLANLYGTERADTSASLGGVDAKIVGTLFQLPGGDVGLAAGVAARKETLSGTPDQNSYNASTAPTKHNWGPGATFFDPFSKDRTVDSYYVETRIPVTGKSWNFPGAHALDLSMAGRVEKYSDAGTSSVPKFGLTWQPYDEQFTLRFTYSKSFAAPFLVDEYGPANFSLGPSPTGIPGINPGLSFYSGNGNNPNLQPSVAWTHSFGFVFRPNMIKGLSATVDYHNVFQAGFQAGVGAVNIFNSINALGSASPYFSAAAVGAAPGQPGASQAPIATPGAILAFVNNPNFQNDLYILDFKINSGGVRQHAADINLNYDMETDHVGRFDFSTTATNLESLLVSPTPGAPYHQFAGYSTNANLFAGSAAKWSFYSTVDWKTGDFDFVVGNSFRTRMIDIPSGVYSDVYLTTNKPTYVASYTTWDTSVNYGKTKMQGFVRGFKASAGVTNLFNRMPPLAPLSYPAAKSNANADTSTYSPIGRLIYVTGSVRF